MRYHAFHCILHATFFFASMNTHTHKFVLYRVHYGNDFHCCLLPLLPYYSYRAVCLRAVLGVFSLSLARLVSFSTIKMNEALLNRAENDDEKQR